MLLGAELGTLAGQVTYARVPLEIRKKSKNFRFGYFNKTIETLHHTKGLVMASGSFETFLCMIKRGRRSNKAMRPRSGRQLEGEFESVKVKGCRLVACTLRLTVRNKAMMLIWAHS